MKLPGICQVCHQPVVWNGKVWRNPGQGQRRHHCSVVCGARMQAGERCGRTPGHQGYHRSLYAMENERLSKRRAA